MPTSNSRLNQYVRFLNALNRAEIEGIKTAQGPGDPMGGMPMDPGMMGGGMPMDPSMMGGGMPMDPNAMGGGMPPMGGGMPMDPSMMGGGMPMDPGMALGIPGNLDPAALGLIPPTAEEGAVTDKDLLEKSLDVSDKALELASAQNKKLEELLGSMEVGGVPEEPAVAPEELEALLAAKEQGATGIV